MLAGKIRKLRTKAGLTQEQLARRADVTNSTIQSIELGRIDNPKISTLKAIADALEVTVDDLIS